MEYVDGDDLQTIVKKKGPLPFDKVAEYIAQAAHGLQHAHDVGLIHRDVKPANILINSKGKVKLLDLGLALFADEAKASLTMDFNDKVLGTADYLAPEQALNSHNVDQRADLYGLGCTMYFLLTGHAPFPEGSIAQRIAKHQKEMPKEIRKIRPECPGELEGICWKMIQKDPKFRYASAQQAAEVLENWLAAYRAAKPVRVGADGSSLSLGDERDLPDAGSGSSARIAFDTVSNRGGDTKSGSSLTNLSTSDSGVIVKMKGASNPSDTSSQIDLQAEIGRRPRTGVSSTHRGPFKAPSKSALPLAPVECTGYRPTAPRTLTQQPAAQAARHQAGVDHFGVNHHVHRGRHSRRAHRAANRNARSRQICNSDCRIKEYSPRCWPLLVCILSSRWTDGWLFR